MSESRSLNPHDQARVDSLRSLALTEAADAVAQEGSTSDQVVPLAEKFYAFLTA